jgi:Mrp family chromosome partitioning ATPase
MAEDFGLASLIERRADEKAPNVAAGEVATVAPEVATVAPLEGLVGLVQALVFEGMDPSSLTYRTCMAGVDCILSGGPFPVTDALASETMDELLKASQERYTIILVIGPALSRGVDTEILAAYAHGMVVALNELAPTPEVKELVRSIQEAKPGLLLGSVLCV